MSIRKIKILHVEDEQSERLLFAHHLTIMTEFAFEIEYAETEQSAMDVFEKGGVEFVILDYNLTHGNGLQCLERIRSVDQIVPVIAISGVASAEIAANLVEAGADDFIGKRDLTAKRLAGSMRDALLRSDTWRKRNIKGKTRKNGGLLPISWSSDNGN